MDTRGLKEIADARRIADKYISVINDLTTSDLQACIGADVALLGYTGEDAWSVEELALIYIQDGK
jgi:hypothetical protein